MPWRIQRSVVLLAFCCAACPTAPGEGDPQARPTAAAANVCGAPGDPTSCSEAAGHCDCGEPHTGKTKVVPANRARVGDLTRCPVSGGVFKVDATTEFVEHQGKRYPVCCAGCGKRFRKNPQKYLGA